MAKSFLDIIDLTSGGNRADFRATVEAQLWTIHFWKTGKALLDEITRKASGALWDTKLRIRYLDGACAYREDEVLYYDPKYCLREPHFEPTQKLVIASNKTYIYLFHELIHFYHDVSGTFRANLEEELLTVGLYDKSHEPLSENALRKDAMLPRRPCYCWQRRADSVTDYERERKIREGKGLPDQSLLTASSNECKF